MWRHLNYDHKKTRDVGLTFWCHLSNIMPDRIFHESMRPRIIVFVSFWFFGGFFVFVCLFVSLFFLLFLFVCFCFFACFFLSLFVSFLFLFFCCFFCGVMLLFSSGWKRWFRFYHYNISGRGEISNYNGLKQMGLITLKWELKSKTRQRISD